MNYKNATEYIKQKIGDRKPETAIILGSGLGVLKDDIENKIIIEYKDIPDFPVSTVEGHAGELIIGELSGKTIIAMNGRFHYYEGYDLKQTVFPIRVFALLGIKNIILTQQSKSKNCLTHSIKRWLRRNSTSQQTQ